MLCQHYCTRRTVVKFFDNPENVYECILLLKTFSNSSCQGLPLYSDSAAPFGSAGAALSVRASFPEGRPPPCLRRFLSISSSKEHFQKAPSPTSPTTHDDQEDISRSRTFHVMLLTSKQCRIGCRLAHQCLSSLGHVIQYTVFITWLEKLPTRRRPIHDYVQSELF